MLHQIFRCRIMSMSDVGQSVCAPPSIGHRLDRVLAEPPAGGMRRAMIVAEMATRIAEVRSDPPVVHFRAC